MQQKIYIKKMTSWTNEAASLSGGKRAPHALERGGQAFGQAPRLLHILEEGGKVEGWLVSVFALFSLHCKFFFMALAKAFKAAEVLRC